MPLCELQALPRRLPLLEQLAEKTSVLVCQGRGIDGLSRAACVQSGRELHRL